MRALVLVGAALAVGAPVQAASISYISGSQRYSAQVVGTFSSVICDRDSGRVTGTGDNAIIAFAGAPSAACPNTLTFTAELDLARSNVTPGGVLVDASVVDTVDSAVTGLGLASQSSGSDRISFSLSEETEVLITANWTTVQHLGNAGGSRTIQLEVGTSGLGADLLGFDTSGADGVQTAQLTLDPGSYTFVVGISGSTTGPSGELGPGRYVASVSASLAVVPEPSTVLLLGAGLLGLACRGRRSRVSLSRPPFGRAPCAARSSRHPRPRR